MTKWSKIHSEKVLYKQHPSAQSHASTDYYQGQTPSVPTNGPHEGTGMWEVGRIEVKEGGTR